MNKDFAIDEEIIRRLVERIIKLEVQHETLRRRVDEPFLELGRHGNEGDVENSKIVLWNRILNLEEDQKNVRKRVQELFTNVMDFELQSRGEPCHLHDQSDDKGGEITRKVDLRDHIETAITLRPGAFGNKLLTTSNSLQVRTFWTLTILLSLSLCGYFMYDSSCRWLRTAPTVSLDSRTALGLIPFPAVTICPGRNIGSHRTLDYLVHRCNSISCTDEELEHLVAATHLCPSMAQNLPIEAWNNYLNNSSPDLIEELMSPCFEDISSYRWQNRAAENCTKAFQTVYVNNRVCYSYNLLPARELFQDSLSSRPVVVDDTNLSVRPEWTPDSLYLQDGMDRTVPLHVGSAGERFKLSISLQRKPHRQPLCDDHFQTHQIAVHPPWELPRPHLRLPLGHSLYVALTPHRVTSSLSSSRCLLPAQGLQRLQQFRHYSQTNCQLECRVRCSLNLCDCVPFYFPRVNNSTRWCGLSRRYCPDTLVPDLMSGKMSWEVIARHYRKEIRDDLHESITDHLYNFPEKEALTEEVLRSLEPDCSCDCPPACTTLAYHVETQLIPLASDRMTNNQSEVHIFYKEGSDLFRSTEINEIFSTSDFVAHFGGLLALFTGLSVISLAEMLYQITCRLWWRLQPQKVSSSGSDRLYNRTEWDKTIKLDPLFITDSTLTLGL